VPTPFPLLRKEEIKVLGAFCPGKKEVFLNLLKIYEKVE
jgi:hypothetical protein